MDVMNRVFKGLFYRSHIFIHFLGEFSERIDSIPSQFLQFVLGLVSHVFHFFNQSQVVQSVNVVVKALGKLLFVWSQIFWNLLMIDNNCKRDYERTDDQGWYAVTPYVDAFVMDHEHALEDFFWWVKINPVPMGNMLVIFHVARGCVVVADGGFWRGLTSVSILLLLLRRLGFGFQFFWGHSGLKNNLNVISQNNQCK